MFGALERGGSALGVLGNGLLDAAGSARYRDLLLSANLTLASPFNPESGFHVGRAMERNRYIYCLADSAVVVSSALGRGGTWRGGDRMPEGRLDPRLGEGPWRDVPWQCGTAQDVGQGPS